MAITLKNAKDIEGLRAANKIVAAALDYAEEFLKPGMTLLEVDKKIDEFITSKGAYPAFKGLYG
ncbi:MAG: M24 family metallopeptidase, partial [Campylobacter sp.]|nr:M24 family metallopeptidase [Campylobacter sp.]